MNYIYSFARQILFILIVVFLFCNKSISQNTYIGNFEFKYDESSPSTIKIIGEKNEQILPFLIDSPKRLVIDIQIEDGKILKEKTFAVKNSSCIQKIRTGYHSNKVRIVLDLNNDCDHIIERSTSEITINFEEQIKPVPVIKETSQNLPSLYITQSVTNTPITPKTIRTSTPAFTNTPATTPTFTYTATTKLTSTPTNTPTPTPTVTLTATATPTISTNIQSNNAVIEKSLNSIDFIHRNNLNQVKINLSERTPFKLSKEDHRKYKISITGFKLNNKGLVLPQFPPNDVVGFTLVRVVVTNSGLEIIINLEDGMKVTAANIDSAIVITSEPAGF
jgi:hypothetical protein